MTPRRAVTHGGRGCAAAAEAGAPGSRRRAQATEALDLGSAVLPVLLKSYWKQAVAAVVGLAVLRRLLRR